MSKIYNADTFLDPKDLKIAELSLKINKLEKTIEAFKEYDKKRTLELKASLIRLGELESEQDEKDYTYKVSDLKREIKQYKRQIAALSAKLHIQKVIEMGDEEALTLVNNKLRDEELIKLRNENGRLRKEYRSIRDEFIALKCNIGKTGEQ
jgi:predicted  nucleic acid-binding Zn-ribbon protein